MADTHRVLHIGQLESFALDGTDSYRHRDKRFQAFACYLALREKLCVEYAALIPHRVPFINDHSRTHLMRVLSHIEDLLCRHLPGEHGNVDIPSGREITWVDSMILLNALIWHDIGNMYGRAGHAAQIVDLFDRVSGLLYEPTLAGYIKTVAMAHSGPDAIELNIPRPLSLRSYHGEDVHLQFLAAVLRFADELDEDQRRISTVDYAELRLVPDAQQRFWWFNKVNQSISVRPSSRTTGTYAPVVEISAHIPRAECGLSFTLDDGTTRLRLSEYLRRLRKFETERQYCNSYLRGAYYHAGVSGFEVKLLLSAVGATPTLYDTITLQINDATSLDDYLRDPGYSVLHQAIEESI